MKSKPTYAPLTPDPTGRLHLLVGVGSGGGPLLRLAREMPAGADIRVHYAPGTEDHGEQLRAVAAELHVFTTPADLVAGLDRVLSECLMGTRLYVAGPEDFLGTVVQVASGHGLGPDAVRREHTGSAARRVYCVHCRTLNEHVTANVARCGGCGLHLSVRDHYSRRLAAYMGVVADAEAPGEVPPAVEAFP